MGDLSLRWDASAVCGHLSPNTLEREERYGYEPGLFNCSGPTGLRYGGGTPSERDRYCQRAVCERTQNQQEVKGNELVVYYKRLVHMRQPIGITPWEEGKLVNPHTLQWLCRETRP